MNTRSPWIPTALAVALLAACGGGGSDSPAPATTASVTMSGTAAKGPMANADVAALPVNADGSIGTAPLATALTDPNGSYTLNFTATKDQPYIIQVKSKANGSTTHVDEVSGQTQNLPAGFSMRALFVPTSTGNLTTSASVTPFSELAVAAATRATGGVTAANAAQAVSTLTQLLGFDPTGAKVKPTSDAGASANEQKLAVLLASVSKLAGTGALGCTTGTPGEVTQCVVGKLSDAASVSTLKLSNGTTDVSAALGAAVTDVLADATLRGNVAPGTLGSIQGNLACTAPCTAAPPATASAIDSARNLFTQIKSDWQTLFSRGGASSIATGAANAEGWKFRQAMNGVQVPASMLVKDLGALLMAVDLYNDYKAGRTLSNSRGRAPDNFNTDTPATVANMNTVGCMLYQDSGTVTAATNPSNANFIGCRASHKINVTGVAATGVTVDWRHGFTITPSATAGEFTYTTRARRRTTNCTVQPCTVDNAALQTNFYSGTVTTTTNGEGSVISFSAVGDLAATFAENGITLVNDHNALNMSGTRTISGNHNETSSLSGTLEAFDVPVAPATMGASLGKLTVKSGSSGEIPVACDANFNEVRPGSATAVVQLCSGAIDHVSLDLLSTTASAEFEGVFSAGPTTWDSTGTDRIPNAAKLSGALRNIEGNTVTEFLQGEFNATATGFAGFNAQQPDSTSNYYTTAVTFAGTVTAPTRPVLKLTASASKKSYETDVASVTMQYSVLVGGTPRTVVAIDVSRGATGGADFKLSEATSGLSMTWLDNATSADLLKGTDVIGRLTQSSKLLTFSNGTVISLDIGL